MSCITPKETQKNRSFCITYHPEIKKYCLHKKSLGTVLRLHGYFIRLLGSRNSLISLIQYFNCICQLYPTGFHFDYFDASLPILINTALN